jgi:Peptidoglycan-synthase activator LpoB
MSRFFKLLITGTLLLINATGCCRCMPTAVDVTPGNLQEKLDWRYGAGDIRIQTTKINRQLFDRWFCKTGYQCQRGKPRIIISSIDNCTDQYIATDMIRDIIEGVAIDDGRYTVVVGQRHDEAELDHLMGKINYEHKYNNASRLQPGRATAPEFLAKVRLTKAIRSDRRYRYEDYRMTVTLYDIETQEAIDSAWDVLSKRVSR